MVYKYEDATYNIEVILGSKNEIIVNDKKVNSKYLSLKKDGVYDVIFYVKEGFPND